MQLLNLAVSISVSDDLVRQMSAQAFVWQPLETGGALAGYWQNERRIIITHVVDAGPNARHQRMSFSPDYDYQVPQLDRIFHTTNGESRYLGDWHSHPLTKFPYLSDKDRRTLKRVALHKEARAPTPVSMVLAGSDNEWIIGAWVGVVRQRAWWSRLISIPANMEQ